MRRRPQPGTGTLEVGQGVGGDPTVGCDVEDPVVADVDRGDHGLGQVVGVQVLHRRIAVGGHTRPGRSQRLGQLAQTVLGHHGRGSQHGDGAGGGQGPLLGQPLQPVPLQGPVEVGVGPDRGVLGDRHRVVLPGAVDHRGRHHHQVGDIDRGERVEHAVQQGGLQLGLGGIERACGHRGSQVHYCVGPGEQGGQVGVGQIHLLGGDRRVGGRRSILVDGHDGHLGALGQPGYDTTTHGAVGAGHHHPGHGHGRRTIAGPRRPRAAQLSFTPLRCPHERRSANRGRAR